ncbi:MAG TPA: hypothetical protein ENH15_04470 [Actinobacteria bacterium]|nr:hypothetical protein [Actinomycetota bacterium]
MLLENWLRLQIPRSNGHSPRRTRRIGDGADLKGQACGRRSGPEGLQLDMQDIAHLLQEPDTTVALIGATDNLSKYGSVIYRDLKRKGIPVFAVNPHRD